MTAPKLINDNEIILVDDDEAEYLIAEHYLKKSSLRNQLLVMSSGDEFLSYMDEVKSGKKKMPAAVLLDIRMPNMDGFMVLEKLRGNAEFAELPVIIMFSNSDAPSDIDKAYKCGANGYQTKPSEGNAFIQFFNSLAPERKQTVS